MVAWRGRRRVLGHEQRRCLVVPWMIVTVLGAPLPSDPGAEEDRDRFRDPPLPSHPIPHRAGGYSQPGGRDRKSTRLNSSHSQISYAVFCLKKKKKEVTTA